MELNDYYYVLANFDSSDLNLVKKFYYEKINPKHKSAKNRNQKTTIKISYFSIDDCFNDDSKYLLEKYPMLGNDCLIQETEPGESPGTHIDGSVSEDPSKQDPQRLSSIIFPIIGTCFESPTLFYGKYSDFESVYVENLYSTFLKHRPQNLDPIAQVSIVDKPVLINTKAWHNVWNNSSQTRLVFSWSCGLGIDFLKARQMLLDKGY